ncbi:hypothetical protein N6H14_26880 [Paenibacillus sp. CC-CFT747]|nr:hypothetical protein N6H14_26880 [Paenibacillus sp. CC-CFT747]
MWRGGDWLPMNVVTEPAPQTVVASPAPTAGTTPKPTYIDEATALRVAKEHNADPSVKWTARFNESMKVEAQHQELPVWIVEGEFPAGNKDIFYVDGITAKVLANTETEAPGLDSRFTEALDGKTDASTGWLLTAADVWRTAKPGTGWNLVTPPNYAAGKAASQSPPKAAFLDKETAVVAVPQAGKPRVTVYRTKDEGKSWQQSELESSFARDRNPDIVQVTFADPEHGWMLLSWGSRQDRIRWRSSAQPTAVLLGLLRRAMIPRTVPAPMGFRLAAAKPAWCLPIPSTVI